MAAERTDLEKVAAVLAKEGWPQGAVSAECSPVYRQLIGFVPPKVQARFCLSGAIDPQVVFMQEEMRNYAMNPKCFEPKTVQLMLFGMLLMELSDATYQHGIAARRAGATWDELQAVVNLVYLFRGLPAANRGADFLAQVAQYEAKQAYEAQQGAGETTAGTSGVGK